MRETRAFGWTIRFFLAAGVLFIALGLWHWGAAEVRGQFGQVFLLTLLGLAWLLIACCMFPWLGLGIADDVIERRNPAALLPLCGAALGIALVYLGGSLGEGPSYWNNIFSAAIGTVVFFLLWCVLELVSGVSKSIAEERNVASGLRLCGFLLAIGLILSRAVAGNWHSESVTVHDCFRDGWPAAGLCLPAAISEWLAAPSLKRPSPPWMLFGLLPALIYCAIAMVWLYHLGPWEGMPI